MLNDIKYLIFDMDGLLVDTESKYREGWIEAFKEIGVDIDSKEVDSWVGKGEYGTKKAVMDLGFSEEVYTEARALREKYIYRMLNAGKILPKPYAREVIEEAKKRGYIIGLATSTSKKRAEDILGYMGMYELFDYRVFKDDVKSLKPSPEIYLKALEKADIKAVNSIAFEDSLPGINAASNAGIMNVYIPDEFFNQNPEDIPDKTIIKWKDLSVLYKIMEFAD